LRIDSVAEPWSGTVRLKWCMGEEVALARREVVLWTHARRLREYLDRARAAGRRPGVMEYKVTHWGGLLALRVDQLCEVAVRFEVLERDHAKLGQ
jgi:hypothetical protein